MVKLIFLIKKPKEVRHIITHIIHNYKKSKQKIEEIVFFTAKINIFLSRQIQ